MTTTLTRQGEQRVLVLDDKIIRSLGIDESTPLSVTVEAGKLIVEPSRPGRVVSLEEAAAESHARYAATYRKLAE